MANLPPWVTKWWDVANQRRQILILKKHQGGGLTEAQEKELTMLQEVAGAIMNYASPPLKQLPPELEKLLAQAEGAKEPSVKP